MVTKGSARRSSRPPSGSGLRGLGLGERRLGELVGDAVLVDGDQRDRPRRRGVAEPGDDAGARQAVAARGADLLGLDELALAGAGAVGRRATCQSRSVRLSMAAMRPPDSPSW